MTDQSPLLQVKGLLKRYVADGPWVVNDVSFDVAPGEILSLVGPSGCGKTTTLRLIAGFERADGGTIALGGQTLCEATAQRNFHERPERRGVGIVFQDYALFPHLSVLRNVMFGMNGSSGDRRRRAMALLGMLDMAEFADRRPQTLSGGQQQRVALARTIAAKPRLVLLDEPFSNLDVTLRESARRHVRQTLVDQGMAAILVTHDREEALSVGDRVAVMDRGRIEQIATPEVIYHQPVNAFVAGFLGGLLHMSADASGTQATSPLGALTLDRSATGSVHVALRPEQVRLRPEGETAVAGIVECREFRGHVQTVVVRIGDTHYALLADSLAVHSPGEAVSIRVDGEAVVLER